MVRATIAGRFLPRSRTRRVSLKSEVFRPPTLLVGANVATRLIMEVRWAAKGGHAAAPFSREGNLSRKKSPPSGLKQFARLPDDPDCTRADLVIAALRKRFGAEWDEDEAICTRIRAAVYWLENQRTLAETIPASWDSDIRASFRSRLADALGELPQATQREKRAHRALCDGIYVLVQKYDRELQGSRNRKRYLGTLPIEFLAYSGLPEGDRKPVKPTVPPFVQIFFSWCWNIAIDAEPKRPMAVLTCIVESVVDLPKAGQDHAKLRQSLRQLIRQHKLNSPKVLEEARKIEDEDELDHPRL